MSAPDRDDLELCTHPATTIYPCFPTHGENVYTEAIYCRHCKEKVGSQNTQRMEWPPFVGGKS